MKPSALVFLLCVVLVFSLQCSGSPPQPGDLQRAVNLSRDACQRLLDVTEDPLPEGGSGGAP